MSTVPRSSISLTFSTFPDSIACNNRAPFFCRVSNFGLFQFRGLQKVSDYLPINLLKPFIELLLHNGNLGGVHPRTWAAGAQQCTGLRSAARSADYPHLWPLKDRPNFFSRSNSLKQSWLQWLSWSLLLWSEGRIQVSGLHTVLSTKLILKFPSLGESELIRAAGAVQHPKNQGMFVSLYCVCLLKINIYLKIGYNERQSLCFSLADQLTWSCVLFL